MTLFRFRIILSVELPAIVPHHRDPIDSQHGRHFKLQDFEKTYLLQNTLNQVSETIATYTYKMGVLQFQFSYSTAIGLFNTVINFICLMLTNTVSKAISRKQAFGKGEEPDLNDNKCLGKRQSTEDKIFSVVLGILSFV